MRVTFTSRAERQIGDLYDYISNQSSEARAESYVSRIVAYCEGLTTFPFRGISRDDILPGLRLTAFERRVTIAFAVSTETILIEGIFYGGRDLASAFPDQI